MQKLSQTPYLTVVLAMVITICMPQATHGTTLLAISYSNSNGYVTINFTNTASYSTYYGLTCNDTIREIPGSVVSATAGVNYISTYFNFNDNIHYSSLMSFSIM
jgi:hypothetical protein